MKKAYYLLILTFFSTMSFANEAKTIVITAKNGKVTQLKDVLSDSVSDYINYSIEEINSPYVIITEQYYEGHRNALLDLNSGKYTDFGGYPFFSSTKKHIVIANADLEAQYTDNALQIYRVEAGKFILEYDAKPTENWGPSSVKWLSPTRIEFLMENSECLFDDNKPCQKYFLTYQNQKWKKELVK